MNTLVSIIIRTYNEARHLEALLSGIVTQVIPGFSVEIVLVDSGSKDNTLNIANSFNCRVFHITPDEFTFGRSLNIGCTKAKGNYLVFISGHCLPVNSDWLNKLIQPLREGEAAYTYGRQVGNEESKFSECQLFEKFYPDVNSIPQKGYFCNNANAAILKDTWKSNNFDEDLSGLEDMELARRLQNNMLSIAYVADASVYHMHEESWSNIRNRYEREAYALQNIMPEVHVSFIDFVRYFSSAVLFDLNEAMKTKKSIKLLPEIAMFRLMQFWGSYRGNHEHRRLSRTMKERYFYPK